ncbi:hypothetical protein N802_06000 [Knoellia sinensis KCTC 19936]|uniref:Glycine zipper domain-containing protein n=1 Tax=Knoellia sinensis KCTC 19936 TaxID=1385520 RepID=A0A0A0J3Q3_9MICO|nr:hypothetical protein [Knoellia sinensis]KGN30757.1 hypothetical protein N802_06000 [Knoellia sinensis KCTC 19936]
MSVDTEIKGKPGNIESAAAWLRDKLEDELSDAGDEFNEARKDGLATWNCGAGDAFGAKMKTARDKADDLAKAATTMATDLDTFAGALRTCQNEMSTCRSTARTDKLTVTSFIIEHPGPAPTRPPQVFTGTKEEVAEHNAKVTAYDDHVLLLQAYYRAETEAARIDRKYGKACRDLQQKYTVGQHASWILTLGDLTGDGVLAGMAVSAGLKHRSALLKKADDLVTEAKNAIDDLQRNPDRYMKRKWIFFKTLDETKLNADKLAIQGKLDEAEDLLKQARNVDHAPTGKLSKLLGIGGKVLGPVGIGLGVYNDYQEGESTTQIVVSQGGSLLVGAGTGMAVGAAVGSVVPVAGTAVGAVVGGIVGGGMAIFSDGAIDSFFENGPDVGKAAEEGWNSIKDTGGAIASGVKGLFD